MSSQGSLESSLDGNEHIRNLRFTFYPEESADILMRGRFFALNDRLNDPFPKDAPVSLEALLPALRLYLRQCPVKERGFPAMYKAVLGAPLQDGLW